MFSFSPPSRHTDRLPHSSSAAGNVQRERDASAAAQLSQLHFAERMPGASLLHAPAERRAGPDGAACEHDSSNSPGDDSNQHRAATGKKGPRLQQATPNASLPQSANLHQKSGHSAAKPDRGQQFEGQHVRRQGSGNQQGRPAGSSLTSPRAAGAATQRAVPLPQARDERPWTLGCSQGPVFVPIVLTMDDADHEHLVEEWGAPADGESACATFTVARQAQHARVL